MVSTINCVFGRCFGGNGSTGRRNCFLSFVNFCMSLVIMLEQVVYLWIVLSLHFASLSQGK